MSTMNPVYGLALHEFSVTQWIEHPPGVWEWVIGSNPGGDSDFSLSHACDMPIISFYFLRLDDSKALIAEGYKN